MTFTLAPTMTCTPSAGVSSALPPKGGTYHHRGPEPPS